MVSILDSISTRVPREEMVQEMRVGKQSGAGQCIHDNGAIVSREYPEPNGQACIPKSAPRQLIINGAL